MPKCIYIIERLDASGGYVISKYKLSRNKTSYVYDELADATIFMEKKHALLRWSVFGVDVFEPPSYDKDYYSFNVDDVMAGKLKRLEIR